VRRNIIQYCAGNPADYADNPPFRQSHKIEIAQGAMTYRIAPAGERITLR